MKDAIHLGKAVQAHHGIQGLRFQKLRPCSVSFPLAGSSVHPGPEAGLGACLAQLQLHPSFASQVLPCFMIGCF